MLEAIHEIAIYIHRFHNLDLFQQGWYQIKVTMRWEDENSGSLGTPARVVQYEAPDLDADYVHGIWRIDDVDHSFSTQPFRIKYAKQDIPLSMMVTFNLSPREFEVPSTSAVILTFELLYSPELDCRGDIQDYLDETAAVHEFRLPPKALLGLHAYCPVHFDAFHAVLVDITLHVSLLKMDCTSSQKVPSDPTTIEDDIREYDKSKKVMVVRALSSSRGILLEELQKLSQAINQPIDMKYISSSKLLGSTLISDLEIPDAEVSGEISSQMSNSSEKLNGADNFHNDVFFRSLSEVKLLELIDLIGNQVLDLWSIFFKFHRANKRKILEFLRNQWAIDRKFEWSTWMVHTKVQMPEQYIGCWVDESSYQPVHGRPAIPQKITDDPAQTAAKQAELLRQSAAKMTVSPIR